MPINAARVVLRMVGLVLASSSVLHAQPRGEVTIGYTFVHAWRHVSFPVDAPVRPAGSFNFDGWEVAGAVYPHPAWGLTAVIGSQDRHVNADNVDAAIGTFLGGMVMRSHRWQGIVPFTRVVAGAVRANADDRDDRIPPDRSQILPTIQVGGGSDVMVNQWVGVRVTADYRRVFQARANHLTTFAGVVIPLR